MIRRAENLENLPAWARDGMRRYLELGIPTGSGMRAILENDLAQAMARCCQTGGSGAYDVWWIVYYLHNWAPAPAWGSPKNVKAWLARDWSEERTHYQQVGDALAWNGGESDDE